MKELMRELVVPFKTHTAFFSDIVNTSSLTSSLTSMGFEGNDEFPHLFIILVKPYIDIPFYYHNDIINK